MIFGPHVENIMDVARLVVERGAGVQVRTPDEFRETVRRIVADARLRERMGKKGLAFLKEHQGAVGRTMKIVGALYKG